MDLLRYFSVKYRIPETFKIETDSIADIPNVVALFQYIAKYIIDTNFKFYHPMPKVISDAEIIKMVLSFLKTANVNIRGVNGNKLFYIFSTFDYMFMILAKSLVKSKNGYKLIYKKKIFDIPKLELSSKGLHFKKEIKFKKWDFSRGLQLDLYIFILFYNEFPRDLSIKLLEFLGVNLDEFYKITTKCHDELLKKGLLCNLDIDNKKADGFYKIKAFDLDSRNGYLMMTKMITTLRPLGVIVKRSNWI